MFESLVNFLSSAALSDSPPLQGTAVGSKMAKPSLASVPATPALSDVDHRTPDADHHDHTHDMAEDPMAVNFSGSLLTPENSRSETSSNNDHAFSDEKTMLRRSSRLVTRAPLHSTETLNVTDNDSTVDTVVAEADVKEQVVNGISAEAPSRSSMLRHSIAVMETSWTQATLVQDHADEEEPVLQCDTPASKELQESTGPSLRSRTLRDQPEATPMKSDAEPPVEHSTEKEEDSGKSLRRSSRLSLLGKAAKVLDKATSVLGKRSRSMMEKGKEWSRRANLRPRNVVHLEGEKDSSALPEPLAVKKRRVSESDLPTKVVEELPLANEESPASASLRFKPKRWLSHGLYIGQDRYMDPRLNEAKNKLKSATRNASVELQRAILPLPMFAGERLLNNGRDFRLPFDIFSPLPPGQPKPDEWRKTNKNVFVGEAASIWKANKPIELSTCTCGKEVGCDENCQNRYMFYECDDSNCKLGQNCGNRSFEELKQRTKTGGKYNIGVEVIKTLDRGYGVRSNRTFEPNQIIVEYTGEIITQTECESRMRTIYKNNECYYLMYFDQNMIIDATRGSIARFVNHSCEPNCRMEKWTVGGKPRMALFAGDRGIMTGEELTYDYNFDPFSQKNVQECRCGVPTCRGVLGPRPKDQRPKEPKVDNKKSSKARVKKGSKVTLAGTKRKAERVLDESTSRLNKKRKILTPKSLKTGVKKAVFKARTAVSMKKRGAQQIKKKISNVKPKAERKTENIKKSKLQPRVQVQSKISAKPRARGPEIKTKPTIKAKSRIKVKTQKRGNLSTKLKAKATVSSRKSKASLENPTTPVTQSPSEQGSSRLKRPSEKVKAQISASAKRSTSLKRLKSRSKTQEIETTQASMRQSSVKGPTKQTIQTVKGGKSGQRRTIRTV